MKLSDTTLAALQFKLADLQDERHWAELADDFAFTNGTLRRIDDEIDEVRRAIMQRQAEAA